MGDWKGTGYISLEPEHYTGRYMITGGIHNEGSTNGGSMDGEVYTAYLVNLICASVDLAESLKLTELVLGAFEIGGVIGGIIGVAVLLLCVTLFVLAIDEYKANMDNLFAYQSGDGQAGQEIIVNAAVNAAVTAAFSGTGYLAKKQLAKYAEKQVAKKLGTELCERLLKDGADSQAVAKAIKALEKAGTSEAVIRKAAGQLTAAEFERIGKLAKRGLAQELLGKVIDNRAVLGNVSDNTLLLFKNSTKSYDDIITMLTRYGDEAGQLYGLYGDDVIEVALKYGDEGLEGIRKHGTDFLVEYCAYGDEFVRSYIKNGDEVLELVIRYSDDAMEGIRKFDDVFVELYRSYGDEFAGNFVKYGDEAVDAYVKYGDDAARVLESGSSSKYYTDIKEWLNSLTQDEIDAILIYTGDDYKAINQYLRGEIEQLPSHLNQDIIDNINQALNRMQSDVPYIVYRGTNIYDDIEKYFIYDLDDNLINVDGLIGKVICEKGFLSTSIDADASFNYLKVHWTIEVPAGSNGAQIDLISYIPEEAEILFPTGQMLLIKDAAIVGDYINILAEIIN